MTAVFLLFLLPIGGGIPAGVLLARAKGIPWPVTALLYLLSDVLLALAFEPLLRLAVTAGRRVPFLARFGTAWKAAQARTASWFQGTGAGPISLVLISFGADPMTGRTSALAAGHGFLAGWAFAIAGDGLYYGAVALSTLRLNATIKNPATTVWIILGGMLALPFLVRAVRRLVPGKA